jgi:hypothetical protein
LESSNLGDWSARMGLGKTWNFESRMPFRTNQGKDPFYPVYLPRDHDWPFTSGNSTFDLAVSAWWNSSYSAVLKCHPFVVLNSSIIDFCEISGRTRENDVIWFDSIRFWSPVHSKSDSILPHMISNRASSTLDGHINDLIIRWKRV